MLISGHEGSPREESWWNGKDAREAGLTAGLHTNSEERDPSPAEQQVREVPQTSRSSYQTFPSYQRMGSRWKDGHPKWSGCLPELPRGTFRQGTLKKGRFYEEVEGKEEGHEEETEFLFARRNLRCKDANSQSMEASEILILTFFSSPQVNPNTRLGSPPLQHYPSPPRTAPAVHGSPPGTGAPRYRPRGSSQPAPVRRE